MRRLHFSTILICACLVLAAASASLAEISGDTVLKNMLDADGRVCFIAREVTTLARGPAVTSEQTVYRAGLRGMRMEYTEPPQMKGEIRVDDGKTLWYYIPKQKLVKQRPSRIASVKHWGQESGGFFKREKPGAKLVGRDKIAGRDAYVIEVRPHFRERATMRKFWVDTEKWIKLKSEEISPEGTVLSTSYYTKIEFVKSIPDSKFRFQPPSGVTVEKEADEGYFRRISIEEARKSAGFRLLEPTYLPKGFKLTGATVVPFRSGKIISFRYTDGVNALSIFQTTGDKLSPKFLEHLRHGPTRSGSEVYSWQVGKVNLTIVSRISLDEVRKVAASVK